MLRYIYIILHYIQWSRQRIYSTDPFESVSIYLFFPQTSSLRYSVSLKILLKKYAAQSVRRNRYKILCGYFRLTAIIIFIVHENIPFGRNKNQHIALFYTHTLYDRFEIKTIDIAIVKPYRVSIIHIIISNHPVCVYIKHSVTYLWRWDLTRLKPPHMT